MKSKSYLYLLAIPLLLVFFISKAYSKNKNIPDFKDLEPTKNDTWTDGYIKANGINFHYVTEGSGPLLLLLHGFPENWSTWREQITFLSKKYKVVALDMRGYNLSDKPKEIDDYKIDILAKDIKAIVNAFNEEKATIIAHDWGGAVAWQFAEDYPNMLEKLVILNSPHPVTFIKSLKTSIQFFHSWYMIAFQLPFLPELFFSFNDYKNSLDSIKKTATYPEKAFNKNDMIYLYQGYKQKDAMTSMINYYRAIFKYKPTGINRKIHVPTLLIWGEKDPFLTKNSIKGIEKFVPEIKIKFIPNASHWVHKDEPELVNKALEEFLF